MSVNLNKDQFKQYQHKGFNRIPLGEILLR